MGTKMHKCTFQLVYIGTCYLYIISGKLYIQYMYNIVFKIEIKRISCIGKVISLRLDHEINNCVVSSINVAKEYGRP